MMLEGMSVRAISRLTGLHKGTILSLMDTAAQRASGANAELSSCSRFHSLAEAQTHSVPICLR